MKKIVPIKLLVLLVILGGCNFKQKVQTKHPGIHFTLGDSVCLKSPKGLIFYGGKYHLFYQYKNDSQLNWGLAASGDMINWKNVASELQPNLLSGLGSGSIITDWDNISGKGDRSSPLLVFYTGYSGEIGQNYEQNHNGQNISMAYSNDDGLTWKCGEDVPVLLENAPKKINDLKVFWHEEIQRWVMVTLSSYDLRFYSSVDLINWSYEYMFEAYTGLVKGKGKHIEFFPVDVEGSYERKWVLLISVDAGSPNQSGGIQYFIGDFDGYSFNCQGRQLNWLDHGSDNYAGVCLSNYQKSGKPLYYLGWVYSNRYGIDGDCTADKNYYTIPRKFSVIKKHNSYFLISNPIDGLEKNKKLISETSFSGKLEIENKFTSPQEINLSFNVSNKLHSDFPEVFGIQLSNNANKEKLTIGYNSRGHYFFISEKVVGMGIDNISFSQYIIEQPLMDIKVIVDYPTVEMFAMDGSIVLTQRLQTPAPWKKKVLFTERGNIEFKGGSLIGLSKN